MCVGGVDAMATETEVHSSVTRDRLGETILAEAEAIRHLFEVLQASLDSGEVQLRETARRELPKTRKTWAAVREMALRADYGPAFKEARKGRGGMVTVLHELLDDDPSSALTDAVKAYALAVKPRVAAMDNQVSNYELTLKGRESYFIGKAMFKDAAKSIKRKRWEVGFREMMGALVEYDVTIYECYPTSR
jgi:hypothetical protein